MANPFQQPPSPRAAAQATIVLRPEDLHPHPLSTAQENQNLIIRLSDSVKKYGILTPLSVRPAADPQGIPYYEIIDGHRRYHAALLAGLTLIPCQILQPNDPKCAKMALISALKAQKMHFFDQSKAFLKLTVDYRMTQEEIARYMQLSQSAVANKLRLLQLTEAEQQQIRQADLTERHARSLLRIKDVPGRSAVLSAVIEKKANVASTDHLVDDYLSSPTTFHAAPVQAAPSSKAIACNPNPAALEASAEGAAMRPIHPSKFALRDLRPLYNSIDRALAIFQKTGAIAECRREESETEACIVIRIPKQIS